MPGPAQPGRQEKQMLGTSMFLLLGWSAMLSTGTPSCDAEPFPDTHRGEPAGACSDPPGLLQGKRCNTVGQPWAVPPVSGEPAVLVLSPA